MPAIFSSVSKGALHAVHFAISHEFNKWWISDCCAPVLTIRSMNAESISSLSSSDRCECIAAMAVSSISGISVVAKLSIKSKTESMMIPDASQLSFSFELDLSQSSSSIWKLHSISHPKRLSVSPSRKFSLESYAAMMVKIKFRTSRLSLYC